MKKNTVSLAKHSINGDTMKENWRKFKMNMKTNKIYKGDSLKVLKSFKDNSIDLIVTDPPYGYSFMGKDWDKAVPNVKIWKECLRVLKQGAFAFVMCAPRSDCLSKMISNLEQAGFIISFTPLFWTYASGFPKACNISKLIDKRLGAERQIIGKKLFTSPKTFPLPTKYKGSRFQDYETAPATEQAKALDGSYSGFQPKPAVEIIIVAMKPITEKTYLEQALKNRKGITWLDDCRIPFDKNDIPEINRNNFKVEQDGKYTGTSYRLKGGTNYNPNLKGRFPANLLVSDNILDNNSRFFDLDKWTLPFLVVPKPSNRERNIGLEKEKYTDQTRINKDAIGCNNPRNRSGTPKKNFHPTVKPIKLMSYLITLGSRKDDIVLDLFVGSGTTCIAAKLLNRQWIGIEKEKDYVDLANSRIKSFGGIKNES